MIRTIVGCVVAAILISSQVLQARQTDDISKIEDAASLFDYFVANGMALTQGDVLIRDRAVTDSINDRNGLNLKEFNDQGMLITTENYYRIVFDFEKNKFAVYRKRHLSRLDLALTVTNGDSDPQVADPYVFDELNGVCYAGDNSSVFQRTFPLALQIKNRSAFPPSDERFLNEIGFVDLRLYRDLSNTHANQRVEYFQRLRTGDSLSQVKRVEEGQFVGQYEVLAELSSKVKIPPPEGATLQYAGVAWRFDAKTLMPISIQPKFLYTMADGTTQKGSSNQKEGIQFTWQMKNNIYVIRSDQVSSLERLSSNTGKTSWGTKNHKVDFHWFSVNEPVDDRFFDGSILKNRQLALDALDPHACGADLLLEESEELLPEKQK